VKHRDTGGPDLLGKRKFAVAVRREGCGKWSESGAQSSAVSKSSPRTDFNTPYRASASTRGTASTRGIAPFEHGERSVVERYTSNLRGAPRQARRMRTRGEGEKRRGTPSIRPCCPSRQRSTADPQSARVWACTHCGVVRIHVPLDETDAHPLCDEVCRLGRAREQAARPGAGAAARPSTPGLATNEGEHGALDKPFRLRRGRGHGIDRSRGRRSARLRGTRERVRGRRAQPSAQTPRAARRARAVRTCTSPRLATQCNS